MKKAGEEEEEEEEAEEEGEEIRDSNRLIPVTQQWGVRSDVRVVEDVQDVQVSPWPPVS